MQVTYDKRDPGLARNLVNNEGLAILKLLVQQASAWYRHGLPPEPECMRHALDDFQKENDRLKLFLDECTLDTGSCIGGVLYDRYQDWCQQQAEPALKRTTFYREIDQRGYRRIRDPHKETISFFGLSLKVSVPE